MGLDVRARINVGVDVDLVDDVSDLDEEPGAELRSTCGGDVGAEVGQRATFLFGHVVAVGTARSDDGTSPRLGADPLQGSVPHGVADVIMVGDGVTCLIRAPRPACQQLWIEAALFGGRMPIENIGEPGP